MPACQYCGGIVSETVSQQNAGRFCSDGCAVAHTVDHKDAHVRLEKAGFKQSLLTPNLFSKNGVSVTVEEVINEGLDTTLARHSKIAIGRRELLNDHGAIGG